MNPLWKVGEQLVVETLHPVSVPTLSHVAITSGSKMDILPCKSSWHNDTQRCPSVSLAVLYTPEVASAGSYWECSLASGRLMRDDM